MLTKGNVLATRTFKKSYVVTKKRRINIESQTLRDSTITIRKIDVIKNYHLR